MTDCAKRGQTVTTETQQTVILLGPRTLQNAVLSTFIKETGTFSCQIISSLSDIRAKNLDKDALFLVDMSSSTYIDLLNPFGDAIKIALINSDDNDDTIIELFQHFDLRGLFIKDTTPELFIKGINSIFAGEYWFSRKLITKLFRQMKRKIQKNPRSTEFENCVNDILTCKELKILQSMVGGDTNQDIAERNFLSPHTVKTHIYNIYKKIGVNNRVQAVSWAREHLRDGIN